MQQPSVGQAIYLCLFLVLLSPSPPVIKAVTSAESTVTPTPGNTIDSTTSVSTDTGTSDTEGTTDSTMSMGTGTSDTEDTTYSTMSMGTGTSDTEGTTDTTETVTGDSGNTTDSTDSDSTTDGTMGTETSSSGGTSETVTGDTTSTFASPEMSTESSSTTETENSTDTTEETVASTTENVTTDETGSTIDGVTDGTGSTQEGLTGTTGSTVDGVTDVTGSTVEGSTSTGSPGSTDTGHTDSDMTGTTTPDTTTSHLPTTTTTQTPTTKKYNYDTSPPNLDGAVYELSFVVIINTDVSDAGTKSPEILKMFNSSFSEKVSEFKEIKVLNIRPHTRTARAAEGNIAKTDGWTSVEYQAVFYADGMINANLTAFTQHVDAVVDEVKSTPIGINFTVQDYKQDLSEFIQKSRDVCSATGDVCPAILEVCNSEDQLCLHRCEYQVCAGNGYCTVVHTDESGTAQDPETKCQCSQDDGLYERSGDNCDVETMKWQFVLAISSGVGGGVILILIIIIVCVCLHRRSSMYKQRLDDHDDDVYLQDLTRHHSTPPSDITDYTRPNESYQPDSPAYHYDGTPDGMSWLHAHDARIAMERQDRAFKSFKPNLRAVDQETDFHIKRPQITSRH